MYRILYVDDQTDLLEIGKLFLEKTDQFCVDITSDTPDVPNLLTTTHYDAIISDYEMPLMDGIALLKTIRSSGNSIPFILFTGKGREDVVIEAINSGADFYLQKGGQPKAQFAELAHKIHQAVQRHRAEKDLARKEANLEAILANTDDIIVSYDPEMHMLEYNQACIDVYRKFFGAELRPGICALDLWPESARDKWIALKNRVMTGETFPFEFRLPGPDGKESFFESFYNPIRENGNVVGFSTFTRDITKRREMEDEIRASYEQIAAAEEELRQQYDELKRDEEIIRESEVRFHDLTEMLPQMVFEADATGKYTYINRIGKQMSQLTDEDVQKGYYIRNHIHPEDLPRLLREFQEISTNLARTAGPAEYRAVRKDGVIVPITAYTIPIIRDDTVKGFRGIVIDMTEKKKTEAAEILANRKLVIMNEVSRHIIRNKMTGLIGCAEMISEASSKNERQAISKEIKDLIYSIKKQIDFTQEYEKVGMTLPVWKNLKQIISGIDSRGIPVVLSFNDYDIFADPLFENLFNYFIENSLEKGENVTEIRFSSQERPDGLVLTYADNGVGIHPSQKLKIFEHHADPRQGVGLLLVREILAITDITITETGVFGEGARFEMLVPPGKFRYPS